MDVTDFCFHHFHMKILNCTKLSYFRVADELIFCDGNSSSFWFKAS